MAQSSIRPFGAAPDRRFDGVVRLVAATLALALALAVINFPSGRPSLAALWSSVAEATRWQPAADGVGARALDPNVVSPENDDGYVEGLTRAFHDDI